MLFSYQGYCGRDMIAMSLSALEPKHMQDRNPAAQQSPAVLRCAILSVRSTGGIGQ